jgi:hypothetical protein
LHEMPRGVVRAGRPARRDDRDAHETGANLGAGW